MGRSPLLHPVAGYCKLLHPRGLQTRSGSESSRGEQAAHRSLMSRSLILSSPFCLFRRFPFCPFSVSPAVYLTRMQQRRSGWEVEHLFREEFGQIVDDVLDREHADRPVGLIDQR